MSVDVDDFITPPPKAGSGVHFWLFGQACRLKDYGATPEEARDYIQASLYKHQPGRDVLDRELNDAVRNAFRVEGEKANGPSWPKPKAKAIRAIVERDGAPTLESLKACSPTHLESLTAEKCTSPEKTDTEIWLTNTVSGLTRTLHFIQGRNPA